MQSIPDAALHASLCKQHRDQIDGLVICLPNFGDKIAIIELVSRARLGVPILLQASNDQVDKMSVSQRRDAFCGKTGVTNNFWQYAVPFTETASQICDTPSAEFGTDLQRFARVCRTVPASAGVLAARINADGGRSGRVKWSGRVVAGPETRQAHLTQAGG